VSSKVFSREEIAGYVENSFFTTKRTKIIAQKIINLLREPAMSILRAGSEGKARVFCNTGSGKSSP